MISQPSAQGIAESIKNVEDAARGDRGVVFAMTRQLAQGLQILFDPFCEVVVHDFSDFEHSIVCLEGSVTGRAIGGAATDLLLEKVTVGDTAQDFHGYLTSLPGGRVMKSSTIFLRDSHGEAYGAFCVNFEISAFIRFQKQLSSFIATEERAGISELLTDDLHTTIQEMVAATIHEMGEAPTLLSRDDKLELIQRLSHKGAFQVKKAVPIMADLLGLSRATVYNYLREIRVDRLS